MNNTPRKPLDRRLLAAAVGIATASLVTLGFQLTDDDEQKRPLPVVELTSDGQDITVPSVVAPGITDLRLEGKIEDGVNVVRLRDGVTYEEAERALAEHDLTRFFTTATIAVGGITHPTSHNDGSWIVDLQPGDHLAVDVNAGVSARFTVSGDDAGGEVPEADGTVIFADGVFTLPSGFGNGTWLVRNDDEIHHELAVLTTDDGHSVDEALDLALEGGAFDSFMQPAGTLNALAPGEEAWVTFDDLHGVVVVGDWLPPLQGVGTNPTLVPLELP